MTTKQYLGLLGFAFVGVWIALGFGDAVLCLLGAGLFYALAAVALGEVDLGDLQDRLRGGGSGASPSRVR